MPPEFCSHGVAWGWCPFTGCRGFRDRNPPPNLDPCPECLGTGRRPRNDDLAKLAKALPEMDLRQHSPTMWAFMHRGEIRRVPAPDAPLPEQMAFVGHLAVALGCRYPRVTQGPHGWLVNLSDDTGAEGYDLAWAACRAAIAAKGGAT